MRKCSVDFWSDVHLSQVTLGSRDVAYFVLEIVKIVPSYCDVLHNCEVCLGLRRERIVEVSKCFSRISLWLKLSAFLDLELLSLESCSCRRDLTILLM